MHVPTFDRGVFEGVELGTSTSPDVRIYQPTPPPPPEIAGLIQGLPNHWFPEKKMPKIKALFLGGYVRVG